ncbi:hypothetical protein OsI_03431 [Oryza sativa Indica Group]|uniref:Uncharacterized protein n=1 Tax=Oryza sativa subsp. indica TaxID=39946 RepID=B8A8B6_ORYSI|nr:hypothetical protein OsI_03431 [Oryza sativa Indica Group]
MVDQTVASLAEESRSSYRAVEKSVDSLLLRQLAGSAGRLSEGPAITSGFGERAPCVRCLDVVASAGEGDDAGLDCEGGLESERDTGRVAIRLSLFTLPTSHLPRDDASSPLGWGRRDGGVRYEGWLDL